MTPEFVEVLTREFAAAQMEEPYEVIATGSNGYLLGFYVSGKGEPPQKTCESGPESGPQGLAYPIDVRLFDSRGEVKLIRILGDCGCGAEVAAS